MKTYRLNLLVVAGLGLFLFSSNAISQVTPKVSVWSAAHKGDIESLKGHIKAGTDLNQKNFRGSAPLHYAVLKSQADAVALLIKSKVDLNAQDGTRRTALDIAFEMDNLEIVQMLVDAGAELQSLADAAKSNHFGIVQFHIDQGVDFGKPESGSGYALMYAITNDHVEMYKLLLKHGAKPTHSDEERSWNALSSAVWKRNPGTVQLLIDHGADVNHLDQYGENVLAQAVVTGNREVVELLIDNGINVNQSSKRGWTPLGHAAHYGLAEMVELLIQRGAKVNPGTKHADSPLMRALYRGDQDWRKWLVKQGVEVDHLKVIDTLIKNGADVNQQSTRGESVLEIAVSYDRLAETQLLLQNKADPNLKNFYGSTPLASAAWFGRVDFIELLLEYGAELEIADKRGYTALVHAMASISRSWSHNEGQALDAEKFQAFELLIEKGASIEPLKNLPNPNLHALVSHDRLEVIKVMMKGKANPNTLDSSNRTPLDIAEAEGFDEIAGFIRDAGGRQGPKMSFYEAINKGRDDLAKLHLSFGTDINQRQGTSGTPFDAAIRKGNKELANLILQQTSITLDPRMGKGGAVDIYGPFGTYSKTPKLTFTIESSTDLAKWKAVGSPETSHGHGRFLLPPDVAAVAAKFFRVAVSEANGE
ncbi:MAG: ankyrin repeat domain-containing protein [Verrucomicrobia bacterium]|nr:ankyrin repeat domain-containing protein [Verrucomicrobiota bacterium]